MKPQRMFWIMAVVAVCFAVSIYFAGKKRRELRMNPPPEKIIIAPTSPTPASTAASGSPTASATAAGMAMSSPSAALTPAPTACKPQAEFFELRNKLGRLVNGPVARYHPSYFLKNINEFRAQYGLPFALATLPDNKLEAEGVVYNNCHPTCKGTVNLVFVSRLVHNRYVEVYTKSGKLKQLPLHDSGLDVATVDELNRQGVPFRSWRVPVVDTDWYISGNTLFYEMDIPGLWLKVDVAGNWTLVSHPNNLAKLTDVEPAVKVPGCVPDENCLQVRQGNRTRYFKSPRACQPVLAHAADEPVEPVASPKATLHPGVRH